MKLNNKILLSNSLLSLFMLLVTGFGMYYVVNSTIYDELDYHLMQHKMDIQNQLLENPQSLEDIQKLGGLGSYEWVEISLETDSARIINNQFSTIDTVRYPALSELPETYRKLEGTFSVEENIYKVEIFEEVAAWEKISMTVLLSVLAALFIWVILLYVVNQYVFGKILSPFYKTIDRLEQISSPTEADVHFPDVNTYEIRVLNQALNTMFGQIKSSFEDQKKFIQNASHELLTPLSITRQKAEKMLTDSEELSRETIDRLNEIQETAVRLSRLSNALLLISRVENKQYELEDQIQITEITQRVRHELQDFVDLKNLHLSTDFNTEIRVKGNSELVHSAIYNIIQNAIKFTPENHHIDIKTGFDENQKPYFVVSDDGPGIPEHLIGEVFDRFKKGESNVKNQDKSPGLGLSIVQSICELHGFTCTAKNNSGSGVSIFLHF
jgi:signal transduction histidine kinase